MQELAERLSQEEIMCEEGVEEDDEEIKKLENEKVMRTYLISISEFLKLFLIICLTRKL